MGGAFMALHPDGPAMACVARIAGVPTTFGGETAAEAYGRALLAALTHG
jgi:hypothetical protein